MITGRLFFRSSTANAAPFATQRRDALLAKREAGMVIGVIKVPKRFPMDGFVPMVGTPKSELLLQETVLPFPAGSMPWMDTVPETPMGSLLNTHCWRSFDVPDSCSVYLRKSVLPESAEHVWALAVGAMTIDKPGAWQDESLLTLEKGRVVDVRDLKQEMRGQAIEGVFRKPLWGPSQDLSIPSSMHINVLRLLQEHEDLACADPSSLSVRETARLSALRSQLRGIIDHNDPDFDRFRDAMRTRLGPTCYLRGQTAAELAERDRVAGEVVREIMEGRHTPQKVASGPGM